MHDSKRLNEALRTDIREKLIKHRFGPELEQLITLYKALADEAYNLTFTVQERKRMNLLPDGWMTEKSFIEVQLGEQKHQLQFNGELYFQQGTSLRHYAYQFWDSRKETERRVPAFYKTKRLPFTDEFVKRVHRGEQQKAAIGEAFSKALKQIDVMLKSYTTVGTLKAAWPEVAPFLPKTQPKPVANRSLPVVSIPSLNTALGLPV